jgi:putative FmdB family regulatory protein
MPLYEYACEKCGERFEVMQKFSDQKLTVHEKCGGPVHRLISAPALQFKGSGWYVTDYAKSGSSSEKSSDNGAPAKSDSPAEKSSTKSDTPAASPSSSSSSSSESKSASSEKK